MKRSLGLALLCSLSLVLLSACEKEPVQTGSVSPDLTASEVSSDTLPAESASSVTVSSEDPSSAAETSSAAPKPSSTVKPSSAAKPSSKTSSAAPAMTKEQIFKAYQNAQKKNQSLKNGSVSATMKMIYSQDGMTIETSVNEIQTFEITASGEKINVECTQKAPGMQIRCFGYAENGTYYLKVEESENGGSYEVVDAETFRAFFISLGDDGEEQDPLKLSDVISATSTKISGGRKFDLTVKAEAFDELIEAGLEQFEGIKIKSENVKLSGVVSDAGYLTEATVHVVVNFTATEDGVTQNFKLDLSMTQKLNKPGQKHTVIVPPELAKR